MEKSIIRNTEQVQAILRGATQFRLPIKPQPYCEEDPTLCEDGKWRGRYRVIRGEEISVEVDEFGPAPYAVGDVIWVKETYARPSFDKLNKQYNPLDTHSVVYAADDGKEWFGAGSNYKQSNRDFRWHPSIHMQKDDARIFLKVKDVRVERVQDISETDAIAEGVESIPKTTPQSHQFYADYHFGFKSASHCTHDAVASYKTLWDSIYSKRGFGWDTNPWVFVYEFARVEQ